MTTTRVDSVSCGDAGSMDVHMWFPDGVDPADPAGSPTIVLIQEIFGVGPYIRAVGERLAAAGYIVGAPDLFWRFEPHWESDHTEAGLGSSMAKAQNLDFPLAIADCVATFNHLAALDSAHAPGVIGFCLGGTLAWALAAAVEPSCCVSYYGSGVPSMLDMIDSVTCPTLFHFGNRDAWIPGEGVEAIGAAIAGRAGFALNVEDAGHAFDNHESEMFHNEAAARAAWSKTMAFLTMYLPVAS